MLRFLYTTRIAKEFFWRFYGISRDKEVFRVDNNCAHFWVNKDEGRATVVFNGFMLSRTAPVRYASIAVIMAVLWKAPHLALGFFLATTDTITADTSWVCPAGVTSVDAECWGAGGHGSNSASGGGGGGGGAYSKTTGVAVTPGNSYTVTVGVPVTNAAGEDSWFSTTGVAPTTTAQGVLAKGGSRTSTTTGAAGGLASTSIGNTKNNGGNGGNGNGGAFNRGGGGGGSGGGGGAGGTGGVSGISGGVGGTAGAATPAGAAGGHGSNTKTNGSVPGGGGGGGDGFGNTPSSGGRGEVRLTYTVILSIPNKVYATNQAPKRASFW